MVKLIYIDIAEEAPGLLPLTCVQYLWQCRAILRHLRGPTCSDGLERPQLCPFGASQDLQLSPHRVLELVRLEAPHNLSDFEEFQPPVEDARHTCQRIPVALACGLEAGSPGPVLPFS